MYGVTLLIAASALGVDYGWQPVENDSLEYIIQIEPGLVAALEAGEAITSEIPVDVEGVRRFRIQIGEDALPQVAPPLLEAGGGGGSPTPAQPPAETPAAEQPPAMHPPVTVGSGGAYGDGGSIYDDNSGSVYGEDAAPREGETPAGTGSGGEFEAPRSVEPPPASSGGGDLFTGSSGMFGGERSSSGGAASTAPPATLPTEDEGPSLDLPLLDPPGGDAGASEVAQPATQPATLPEPSPSPFRQPQEFTPPQPAGELTGFETEEEADHEEDHAEHEDHQQASTTSSGAAAPPAESENEAAGRPWLPLTLTLLLLFASIGGNLYLGWILLETLARYRRLQTERAG